MAFRVRVPAWAIFYYVFNFSKIIIPNTKTVFYFQTDKQEEIFNNFEIRNYLNISLDYCCGFTYWFDGLLLLLIVITHEASKICS